MGKIEKLLDKTKRNGETKKWVLYIAIIITIFLIGFAYGALYLNTPDFEYNGLIEQNPTIKQSYFLHEQMERGNETVVYFIGSSVIGTAVNPPTINTLLLQKGYNIHTYDLNIGADVPRERILLLNELISAKPDLIIYGTSYYDMHFSGYKPLRFTYLDNMYSPNYNYRNYFNSNDLEKIDQSIIDYRLDRYSYWKNGLQHFSLVRDEIFNEKVFHTYIYGDYTREYRLNMEKQKNVNSIINVAKSWYGGMTFTSETDLQNFAALKEIVSSLNNADINTIVISMPFHPICYAEIPIDAKNQYHKLLSDVDSNWIDMETIFDDACFYDQVHKTELGCQKFNVLMADLIIQELT